MAKRLQELGFGTVAIEPATVLVELDRGLRSSRIQDQCESVFWLGRLMSMHPTPLIVNTVIVKLTELFRTTANNFIRHCILRTVRQSHQLLGCVLNRETVLQRVLATLDENQAESRAIALRLLGAMAVLSAESPAVHHRVCGVLSAPHECESEAALWAAQKLAPKSKAFSSAALSVIRECATSIETSPATLLRMLQVVAAMAHTEQSAHQAHELCSSMLRTHPTAGFVPVLLDSLTSIAERFWVDRVQQQLDTLCAYMQRADETDRTRQCAVKGLAQLIGHHPNAVQPEHIEQLEQLALSLNEQPELQALSLDALVVANQNPLCCVWQQLKMEPYSALLAHPSAALVRAAAVLLSTSKEGLPAALQLAILSKLLGDEAALRTVRRALSSRLQLLEDPSEDIQFLQDAVCAALQGSDPRLVGALCQLILPCLMYPEKQIAQNADGFQRLLTLVVEQLAAREAVVCDPKVLTTVCCLVARRAGSAAQRQAVVDQLQPALKQLAGGSLAWSVYRVCCDMACCHNQYLPGCAEVLDAIGHTGSEASSWWLQGLARLMEAESIESSLPTMVEKLSKAASCFTAAAHGQASSTSGVRLGGGLPMQQEYVSVRTGLVQLVHQLSELFEELPSSPPHNNLSVCAWRALGFRALRSMKSTGAALLTQMWCLLRMDLEWGERSKRCVSQMLTVTVVLKHRISEMAAASGSDVGAVGDDRELAVLNALQLMRADSAQCSELEDVCRRWCKPAEDSADVQIIAQQIHQLLTALRQTTLVLPPFLFKPSVTIPQVELTISPSPKSSREPLQLIKDTRLVLNLVGYVKQLSENARRQLRSVQITVHVAHNVSSTQRSEKLQKLARSSSYHPSSDSCVLSLALPFQRGTVASFSGDCILEFPSAPGTHLVVLRSELVDAEGVRWVGDRNFNCSNFGVKVVVPPNAK